MSRLDRRSRQSQVGFPLRAAELNLLAAVLSVATLCESGIAERALNKQAQRVDYNPNQETADPEPETPSGGNGSGGGNGNGELEE